MQVCRAALIVLELVTFCTNLTAVGDPTIRYVRYPGDIATRHSDRASLGCPLASLSLRPFPLELSLCP